MRRFFVAASVATGLASAGAWAAQKLPIHTNTAGELAEICGVAPHSQGADEKINFCHGFAQGAIDVELSHAGDKKPFCFPNPSPTREETMNQFVNWVRAMPDRRSLPSTDGLFRFLAERFPCK
jgi:Rap1a immunity proteins